MKKFSLFLLIALIIGSIFVSCSSDLETADSSTAKVALNMSATKALTVTVETEELPSADDLTWYYTAEKGPNDENGFTTGQTTVETLLRADGQKGIPARIGYSNADPDNSGTWFSTGNWIFNFYGMDGETTYYSALNVPVTVIAATEGNNVGGEANITLGLHNNNDPRHDCYVYINSDTGITVDLGKSFESSAGYTMNVYLDSRTNPIKTINGTQVGTSSEVTFKGTNNDNIIGSVTDLAAVFHTLTFRVFKGNIVYAEGAVDITVKKGVTWTISGSLDNLDAVAQVAINQGNSVVGFTFDNFGDSIILIDSAEELAAFATYVNDGNNCSGKTIYLARNIDISSIANWIPIGNSARKDNSTNAAYFAGTFDGSGYTITGLKLTSVTDNLKFDANQEDTSAQGIYFNEYLFGLFGTVKNATIKNLTLSGVSIANLNSNIDTTHKLTGENIGALIGYSEGSLTVDNITVASGSVAGGSNVAGIIGRAYGKSTEAKISITNCVNYADITSTNGSGNKAKAAGIVGYLSGLGAEVVVENCTNYGALSSTADKHAIAAGIVNYGFNNSCTDNYTVKNNSNSGAITLSSATGCLYAAISAECNEGKQENDTIFAQGNTNTGTITVNNATVSAPVLVRSSQNGPEENNT